MDCLQRVTEGVTTMRCVTSAESRFSFDKIVFVNTTALVRFKHDDLRALTSPEIMFAGSVVPLKKKKRRKEEEGKKLEGDGI